MMKTLTRRLLSALRAVSPTTKREPSADVSSDLDDCLGTDCEKSSEPARSQAAPVSPDLQAMCRVMFNLGRASGVADGWSRGFTTGREVGIDLGYNDALSDVQNVIDAAGEMNSESLAVLRDGFKLSDKLQQEKVN